MQISVYLYAHVSCPFQSSFVQESVYLLMILSFYWTSIYDECVQIRKLFYCGNVYLASRKFLVHSNVRLNNPYSSNLNVRVCKVWRSRSCNKISVFCFLHFKCKMYAIGFSETLVPSVKLQGVTSCKTINLIFILYRNRGLADQISHPCKSNRRSKDYNEWAWNCSCDTKVYNGLFSYLSFIKIRFAKAGCSTSSAKEIISYCGTQRSVLKCCVL